MHQSLAHTFVDDAILFQEAQHLFHPHVEVFDISFPPLHEVIAEAIVNLCRPPQTVNDGRGDHLAYTTCTARMEPVARGT